MVVGMNVVGSIRGIVPWFVKCVLVVRAVCLLVVIVVKKSLFDTGFGPAFDHPSVLLHWFGARWSASG